MNKFVFWTGVYNIVAGISFLFPGIVSLLGVKLPGSNFWVWVVASAVIYLGIAFYGLSNGKITEVWGLNDALGIMQQIGAIPPK